MDYELTLADQAVSIKIRALKAVIMDLTLRHRNILSSDRPAEAKWSWQLRPRWQLRPWQLRPMVTQTGDNSGRWQLRPVATQAGGNKANTVCILNNRWLKCRVTNGKKEREINNERIVCIKYWNTQEWNVNWGKENTIYQCVHETTSAESQIHYSIVGAIHEVKIRQGTRS